VLPHALRAKFFAGMDVGGLADEREMMYFYSYYNFPQIFIAVALLN